MAVLRRLRTRRGQGLVEMAIMAPVLFFIVLGASDLARIFYYTTAITNAAREGARHGAYWDPIGHGNTYATDSAIYSAASTEATQTAAGSYLNLSEPCHPNTSCTGGLTNCPSYPYAATLYPPATSPNSGYVFICFNNTTTATTSAIGQPIQVTILYTFQTVTPLMGGIAHAAASTEILTEGNN